MAVLAATVVSTTVTGLATALVRITGSRVGTDRAPTPDGAAGTYASARGAANRASSDRVPAPDGAAGPDASATSGASRRAAAGLAACRSSAWSSFRNRTNRAAGPVTNRGGSATRRRGANGALRAARSGTKAANGPGHVAGALRRAVGIGAQGLRENGTTAELLAADNADAAVAVHRRIGDGRHALLPRPDGLGIGRGRGGKEQGHARQSESVRTLHSSPTGI
jgi:hypothetical protein